MVIVSNKETGIRETFTETSLDFIRRSYEEYSDIEMGPDEYKSLALKLTRSKYAGSRYENLEWVVEVE